ncbi:branched-chain amino acid ABC transporter permease [Pseudofrankia inefficax]|uniref:Inner-membrane translocator n=1 Tax=Pseudofrankia inefficax (strain DSM 45817 / CECT 9037 / DDB 130130 / EuI1c) TaxID=298654 RepID=E3J1V1_PSEI1|nr:branched-chain amino acid ABC transporter permease [Pseudofrankia inefficax]ADP82909.1 inner-membrane translocator [Pseudofrankia inefficax]
MTPASPGAGEPPETGDGDLGLPDVRVLVERLGSGGARPPEPPPAWPPSEAGPSSGRAAAAEPARGGQPRTGASRWRSLGGCLVLALIAALATGPSGDGDRPLAGARGSLAGARGALFLSAAVLAWLGVTWSPWLRGWLAGPPRRVADRARERAAGIRDRAGLRRRHHRRRLRRLIQAARDLAGAARHGARLALPLAGRRRRARLAGRPAAVRPVRPSLADALSRPSRQAAEATGATLQEGDPRAASGERTAAPEVAPWHRTWAARSKWTVPAQGGRGHGGGALAAAAPATAGGRRGRRSVRTVGYAVALAAAVVAPLSVSTAAQQSMVNDIGLYALLALGLNVVVGYAGLLDLGYIAFFAIGAYTAAYLCSATAMPWHAPVRINPFLAMPVAVAVAALAGIALGAPTLRLRGDYLAIVTLGFGEIVQLLANNADGITGGARGVFGVPPLSVHAGGFHYAWGLEPLPYYYLLVVLVILVMAVLGVWERSRTGRAWAAIRQDEVAAEATGVRTMRMKLLAFAIGASVSGFAGVVLATKQFFNPQTFSLQASLLVLTVVIFGGMGSRLGVVVGAVVLQGLAFFLRDRVPAADRFIYFGAIVMIMMVFRPQGLLPPRPLGASPVPAPGPGTAAAGPAQRRAPVGAGSPDEVPTVPREGRA